MTMINADINNSAAIAGTKISPSFGSQNVVTTGTSTAGAFIPTSASIPQNGMYLPIANTVAMTVNGVEHIRLRSNGNIGHGGTGASNVSHYNQESLTGNIQAYAHRITSTIQSDVTLAAWGFLTEVGSAVASFTCASLNHFAASQQAIGSGSTITNQYGFRALNNLTGATNNYAFYADSASAVGRWNFYANNTAPNYFAGDLRSNTVLTQRTSPANSNVTTTATASSLIDGLRTGTPTANIDLQVPTGTNMDAAFQELQTNQAFEWSVINLASATHVITVTANTDHTAVGNMAVAAATSGRFLTRKTAANTFVTYRIA